MSKQIPALAVMGSTTGNIVMSVLYAIFDTFYTKFEIICKFLSNSIILAFILEETLIAVWPIHIPSTVHNS